MAPRTSSAPRFNPTFTAYQSVQALLLGMRGLVNDYEGPTGQHTPVCCALCRNRDEESGTCKPHVRASSTNLVQLVRSRPRTFYSNLRYRRTDSLSQVFAPHTSRVVHAQRYSTHTIAYFTKQCGVFESPHSGGAIEEGIQWMDYMHTILILHDSGEH